MNFYSGRKELTNNGWWTTIVHNYGFQLPLSLTENLICLTFALLHALLSQTVDAPNYLLNAPYILSLIFNFSYFLFFLGIFFFFFFL